MMNQQQHPPPLMNMNQSWTTTNQINQRQQVIFSNQRNLFAHPYTIPQPINPIDFRPQMNPGYPMWPPQHQFRNPNSVNKKSLSPRSNWKGKKVNSKLNSRRRMPLKGSLIPKTPNFKNLNGPRTLNESQYQNSLKTQIFDNNCIKSPPFAPRNTTSFIIRSKKGGGIAPLVSPCPVTPSVLPTPVLSPSRELLMDMVKEEWGVDGYGSMKGLIRLRSSPGHEMEEGGSSGSDVKEHAEVEKRLNHDLSRFEMVFNCLDGVNYLVDNGMDDQGRSSVSDMEEHAEERRSDYVLSPFEMVSNYPSGVTDLLENGVDDQGAHIAKLEKDNLNLKEKLLFMEREVGDLRRRMVCLERAVECEVVETRSKNESDGCNSSEEDITNVDEKKDYIGLEKDDTK